MSFGLWEILGIIVLVMILFGAGKLPHVMKDLAGGVKAFKQGMREEDESSAPVTRSEEKDIQNKVE